MIKRFILVFVSNIIFLLVYILFIHPTYAYSSEISSVSEKKVITMVFPESRENFLGKWLYQSYAEAFKRLI